MSNGLTCAVARQEISASAHGGKGPDAALATHLKTCGDCREAWDTRQDLVRHLGAMQQAAVGQNPSAGRRAELMQRFAAQHQRQPAPRWRWALAMAAAVVLMAGARPALWDLWTSRGSVAEETAENSADGDGQEGFMAVPYAPAAAPGEMLRVVRTELYPAALASLGLDMDPSLTGKMPADLLVGEDGYPRAVRISSDVDGSF